MSSSMERCGKVRRVDLRRICVEVISCELEQNAYGRRSLQEIGSGIINRMSG